MPRPRNAQTAARPHNQPLRLRLRAVVSRRPTVNWFLFDGLARRLRTLQGLVLRRPRSLGSSSGGAGEALAHVDQAGDPIDQPPASDAGLSVAEGLRLRPDVLDLLSGSPRGLGQDAAPAVGLGVAHLVPSTGLRGAAAAAADGGD